MKRNRENLNKLSELCEYLSDRDVKIKEEHLLLRTMAKDLPLKFFALKINNEMKIETQLGESIPNLSGKNLTDIFEKDSEYITSYTKSLSGEVTKVKVNIDGKTFECINNPIKTDDGKINSIVSVAWGIV